MEFESGLHWIAHTRVVGQSGDRRSFQESVLFKESGRFQLPTNLLAADDAVNRHTAFMDSFSATPRNVHDVRGRSSRRRPSIAHLRHPKVERCMVFVLVAPLQKIEYLLHTVTNRTEE